LEHARKLCQVSIVHEGQRQEFQIRKGLGFQALVAQHRDIPLEFDCRAADCGVCLIKVLDGDAHLSPPTTGEKDFLKAMLAHPAERLACQCRVLGPTTIEIPLP
jgi:ferredoxin